MAKQQNLIFQIIGREFDVVSTIDHSYTSPPIHLFDGHLNLLQKYSSKEYSKFLGNERIIRLC